MSEEAKVEQGSISIHTENIFPIIKKWLYSEHEIFLRELVSNAVDAIHKLQHVNLIEGLQLSDDYVVDIEADKAAGTLTIRDNGIGMTAEEIRKYINQIAFSSAEEFVERFKDLEDQKQIIGHFGLGFYSAFMVADKVEIRSLSYAEGAEGAHWSCDGTTSYELRPFPKSERGTDIILHLAEDAKEFLEPARLREILKRYCNFLPLPIRLAGETVNDSEPLWSRTPSEVSDEQYLEFYRKLYPLAEDPLFWIHLNIDFPFNLKGIVYFPRLTNEFDVAGSHIKLFCNQVFVSDDCKELIPEFLTPLQGCLDAPDLPLNVSRSYLQNEPQVRKIQEVLAGRVAGKVVDLSKDLEQFGPIWEDIHTFVKFGMMKDEKFYKKLSDKIVFRTTGEEKYTTLAAYLERAKEQHADKVFYTSDEAAQAPYLKLFADQGFEVLKLEAMIDSHFLQFLEMKNSEVKFERIDADVADALLDKDAGKEIASGKDQKTLSEALQDFFGEVLDVSGLKVRVEALRDTAVPGVVLLNEQTRRFKEMTRAMGDAEPDLFAEHTLLVNSANPVAKSIRSLQEGGAVEKAELLARQVYDLACLSQRSFDKERMEAFLERSSTILQMAGDNS